MPETTDVDEFELARDINDAYREARMNVMYYGRRVAAIEWRTTIVDVAIAVGTSGTIASLALWKYDVGRVVITSIAAAAAILGVAKPFLRLPAQLERSTRLWMAYNAAFIALDRTTRDMRLHNRIRPESRKAATAAVEGFTRLANDEDRDPDADLLQRCRDAVEVEIPKDRLWWPPTATYPAPDSAAVV